MAFPVQIFKIHILRDREARTLTVSDNGIGMTKKSLKTTWA